MDIISKMAADFNDIFPGLNPMGVLLLFVFFIAMLICSEYAKMLVLLLEKECTAKSEK